MSLHGDKKQGGECVRTPFAREVKSYLPILLRLVVRQNSTILRPGTNQVVREVGKDQGAAGSKDS